MKTIKKILPLVILFIGLQVSAQSYQRWITFGGTEGYQVTPSEMADITNALYDNFIKPNVWYKLSTGAIYRVNQPDKYLKYIEKCVKVSDTNATTPQKVVEAIKNGEKLRWGTDISFKVKNFWIKSDGSVTFYDNYSGFGMPTYFIFINGIPTIKCDCGNPLEAIDILPTAPIEGKRDEKAKTPEPQLPVIPVAQEDSPTLPKNIGELRTAILSTPTPVQQPLIPSVKRNWKPVIWIGGVAVTASLGYLAYTLLKSKPTTPDPGGPVDPTGGDTGGGPVDPTGP